MLSGKHCQRAVRSHSGHRLRPIKRHGKNHGLILFISISISLLQPCPLLLVHKRHPFIGNGKAFQIHQIIVQPFPIGLTPCIAHFQILIIHQLSLHSVNEKHFSWMKTLFFHHMTLGNGNGSHFRSQNHLIFVCNIIPGRTQPVSVQHSPQNISVAEHN